jgi:multidrug efflux system membrane fusion protein
VDKVKYILEKLKKSPLFAIGFVITLIFGLLLLRKFSGFQESTVKELIPRVRTQTVEAKKIKNTITRTGRTEPNRYINLITRIDAYVKKIHKLQGSIAKKGDILIELDSEDRDEKLAEMQALVKQRSIELESDEKLAKRNFKAGNDIAASKTRLHEAIAKKVLAEKQLNHCTIRAPFDGILDDVIVEEGSTVNTLSALQLGKFVELSPLKFVTYISEDDLPFVKVGAQVPVYINGLKKIFQGSVVYLSKVAQEETKTYRVEILVDNKEGLLCSGLSGHVKLGWEDVYGHYIPASILVLADDGTVGVKIVESEKARFVPIQIIDATIDGVWTKGLPEKSEIITVGGDFVEEGSKVEADAMALKAHNPMDHSPSLDTSDPLPSPTIAK